MAHPYRTRPKPPPTYPTDEARLRTATFAFAFLCVLGGQALSGADRAKCGLLATLGGVVLLITRQRAH